MSEYIRREIRLPETVSPFGPGAIADIAGDSLVAPDLSRWSTKTAQPIACERLAVVGHEVLDMGAGLR